MLILSIGMTPFLIIKPRAGQEKRTVMVAFTLHSSAMVFVRDCKKFKGLYDRI